MSDEGNQPDPRRHRETRRHLRGNRKIALWLLAALGVLIVLVIVLGLASVR